MWDVKKNFTIELFTQSFSFTLTMWDVKYFDSTRYSGGTIAFYLNYVGCKDYETKS